MDIDAQRKIALILRILSDGGSSMGSKKIARELAAKGVDLQERMVRYYLEQMDGLGFTENLGRPGRRLTDLGREELDSAVAVDRVGFVSARVDQFAYRLSFDPERAEGTVLLNISFLPAGQLNKAKSIARKVISAGLGMGRLMVIAKSGDAISGHAVPKGSVGFGTVCSVTLNGVLCSHGIPVVSRFGGLVEMNGGEPVRFTQIINYDGTTIDPIEIFIKGKMTSVNDAAQTGTGIIGAGFREIPVAALPRVREIIAKLDDIGLGGVLMVGLPGKPLLDVPVSQGRVGLIVAPGLNPIAAVEEAGIPTENRAMAVLCEFSELRPLD